MALISQLIKKYEAEAQQRIMEARKQNGTVDAPVVNREDLFLKTERASGTAGAIDDINTDRRGSIWKSRPEECVRLEPTSFVENKPQSPGNGGNGSEIDSIRKENEELKERLSKLENMLQTQQSQ